MKPLITALLACVCLGSLEAQTIYVNASNNRSGNGTVNNPYNKIQPGILKAKNGDVVSVQSGTYNEAIDFKGKAITVQSTSGPETTIIDAAGLGQVSVVTFKTSEGQSSVLQGFTIKNGKGSVQTQSGVYFGGGIVCVGTSPKISNVVVIGNSANYGGGIAGINGSNCLMTNVVLTNNSATVNGGGAVFMNSSRPSFLSCSFTGNSADHTGGAINVRDSIPLISNCDFNSNNATDMGGAIRIGALSSATIDNCRFYSNTSNFGGGLAAGSDTAGTTGTVTITNSIFDINSAPNGTQLSINGIYPAYINISFSFVSGGNTQESAFVDTKWDRTTYLLWGNGMTP